MSQNQSPSSLSTCDLFSERLVPSGGGLGHYLLGFDIFDMCMLVLRPVLLFVTPWTVAHQAPLSMGFSRQEYWSELPFPPPGDLPNPGTQPLSLVSLHCNRILNQQCHLRSLNLGLINKVCLVLKHLGSNFYFSTILKHRRKQPWILSVFYK